MRVTHPGFSCNQRSTHFSYKKLATCEIDHGDSDGNNKPTVLVYQPIVNSQRTRVYLVHVCEDNCPTRSNYGDTCKAKYCFNTTVINVVNPFTGLI
jgi:hypothetical protein